MQQILLSILHTVLKPVVYNHTMAAPYYYYY